MKILIIEDNRALVKNLKVGLSEFQIDSAYDGIEGEILALTNHYDAIILDLNLPEKDGIEVLRTIRSEGVHAPVIILSARSTLTDRTLGLDIGADDYLPKPFEIAELHSRINALIRRSYGRSQSELIIGDLHLDPLSRTVSFQKRVFELKPKEFDILECIMIRHPQVVSSEAIAEHVYDDSYDPFSSVLRVHLARLRKALIDVSGDEILINIRGKGYYLCEK